jgi:tetratricopeptide (TPR) repeat protein
MTTAALRRITSHMPDSPETLRQAQGHFQGGRFPEAIKLLEQASRLRPADAAVHLGLGVALQAAGQTQSAVAAYNRCIELKADHVEAWCRLATAHQQLKQLDQAATAYLRAIELAPSFAEAACNLGGILLELNRTPEAIEAFRRALAHKPQFPEAQNGLGIALKNAHQPTEAIAAFQQALALRPLYAEAWYNLGNTFQSLERWSDAVEAYGKAQQIGPPSHDVFNNLGLALWNLREFNAAAVAHEKAVALKPESAEAYNNWGNDLLALGHHEEAAAKFERAASLRPGYREALCNLGNVFIAQNRADEAIDAYCRAAADTTFPDADYNEALALLLKGDFVQGLPKYESRWASKSSGLQPRRYSQSRWQGEDIAGRTILLHTEQGLGDTLQFLRYVPLVAQRGAKIILCVQPPLKNLLAAFPGVDRVQTNSENLPPFDFYCSLLSLSLIFKTELHSIPARVPYLVAPAEKIALWRAKFASSKGLKVGIVCSGNPKHKNDHNRSLPLSMFAPLAALTSSSLYFVQKELKPADVATIAGSDTFVDLSHELADFTDTAAIIANLDLVISVDTSVVHLAGALGKPVWTLLPYAPDWRWMLSREDSPWYPTMRLFRQPAPGNWTSVMDRVSAALKTLSRA